MHMIAKYFKQYLSNYGSLPKLAWLILPLIIADTFVTAICLNISVYFIKVWHFEPLRIGMAISFYYGGSFIGALAGGILSLRYSSLMLSGISSIFLGLAFLRLVIIGDSIDLEAAMLGIGLLVHFLSINNLASFVKTANGDPAKKLQLIVLDFVIFNLGFSLSAFVLIRLNVLQINYILISIGFALLVLGGLTCCFRKIPVFNAPRLLKNEALCKPQSYSKMLFILLTVLCIGLIFSMIKVIYLPTIMQRFGENIISVFTVSMNPWLIFLLQPSLTNRLKHKNNAVCMAFGGLLIGLSYFFFGIASTLVFSILALILLTFGEMIYSPISKNALIGLFDNGREGFALGLWKAVFLGSGFIGPTFAGWLITKYNSMLVWDFCALLGLCCFLFSIFTDQRLNNFYKLKRIN